MRQIDVKKGVWIQHVGLAGERDPQQVINIFSSGRIELKKRPDCPRVIDPCDFENYRLWKPDVGDRVLRGGFKPMIFEFTDERVESPENCVIKNIETGRGIICRLHELEPYIEQDKVRAKEITGESSGVKAGKAKFEVGDKVIARLRHHKNVPFRGEIISKAYARDATDWIVIADEDIKFRDNDSFPKGSKWGVYNEDLRPIEVEKEKCGCEGSGFLNADQIPADVFIEGTEAIVGWIEETNAPFEDCGCSCHCGNPPCSYCTDSTLAEVCPCNRFADDYKGQDPLEGRTYGDIVGDKESKDKTQNGIKEFGRVCREFKEAVLSDPETCMTEGDFIGHEDSPDGHGHWMDGFQEMGRRLRGGRNGLLGHRN